jgi:hypothetical protein
VNPVERRISVFEPFKLLLLFVISSGPGPIGGVIFTTGLLFAGLLFARKFKDQVIKNCFFSFIVHCMRTNRIADFFTIQTRRHLVTTG